AKGTQALVQVMLPDRLVPIRGPTLEFLSTPDVVDEHVDVAVLCSDLIGEHTHLLGVEMVDGQGDANAAQLRDQLGRLLDRFSTVVLGAMRACAAAGADDGRASFAKRRSDAS